MAHASTADRDDARRRNGMLHEKGEKRRIALLIVVAVLAIALAMLEALADNVPTAAVAAPSVLAPPPNVSEPPADDSTYSQITARSSFE
jgi:hypothetical protein